MNTIYHQECALKKHIIQVFAEKEYLFGLKLICKLKKDNGLERLKITIRYFL